MSRHRTWGNFTVFSNCDVHLGNWIFLRHSIVNGRFSSNNSSSLFFCDLFLVDGDVDVDADADADDDEEEVDDRWWFEIDFESISSSSRPR